MQIRLLLLGLIFSAYVSATPQNLTPLVGSNALTYLNGAYYAFNVKNQVLSSTDLKTWTTYSVPTTSPIKRLAFGGGTYLVATDHQILVSNNLVDFETVNLSVRNLLFEGTRWLAASASGIWSSTNGLQWESEKQGNFTALAHTGGITVAVGSHIAVSEGQGFTDVENSPENLLFVVGQGGLFVATNSNGQVTVSSDGRSWSHLASRNVSGTLFAARGRFYTSAFGVVKTSVNGLDWADFGHNYGEVKSIFDDGTRTLAFGHEIQNIDADGGPIFVAFGHDDSMTPYVIADQLLLFRRSGIYLSSNGLDWTKTSEHFDSSFSATSEEALVFINNDRLRVTQDGVTWHNLNLPFYPGRINRTPTGFLLSARFNDLNSCAFLYSQDGLNWVEMAAHCLAADAIVSNGVMLSSKEGQLWRSTDLVDWQPVGAPVNQTGQVIAFGDSFLVRGERNDFMISPDGLRFERINRGGQIFGVGGLWNLVGDMSYYSSDGRVWAESEIGGRPLVIWQGKVVWSNQAIYVSQLPQQAPTQAIMIPWVVQNQTWQSRVVLNNTNDATVMVDLEAVTEDRNVQRLSLSLAPGEILVRDPEALFPGTTRYSLFITAHGSGVFPVFQVNALIDGVYSPSQSGAIFLDKITNRLIFPFMAATDINALVLIETKQINFNSRAVVHLLDKEGKELAATYVYLYSKVPFAAVVTDLFPDLTLPDHFTIRVDEGQQLAGTAFIFNQEGQPSMANAFSPVN